MEYQTIPLSLVLELLGVFLILVHLSVEIELISVRLALVKTGVNSV